VQTITVVDNYVDRQIIQESSFWTFIQTEIIQTHRFKLCNHIYKFIVKQYCLCTIHVQNYTVKQYCLCTLHVQNYIIKNTIHFNFLLTEESEPRWFFFGRFIFLGGEGGGGDSGPMANLATWSLLIGWMTSLFINPNNCSYTARILHGVRYCLLKSISCNFKNERSEVCSMCLGIKIQNKPHMH
jgi:hypothetical protein